MNGSHYPAREPLVKVETHDGYDFYRGDRLWNIVPEGSQAPTGGYSSRDFIEEVKRVKFKETA